jgi:Sec-independent protein translocase protein TatA
VTRVLAFLDIGFGELLLCAVVALLLFGGRLPEAMTKFGSMYRGFRRGLEDLKRSVDAPPERTAYRPRPTTPLSSGVGEPPAPPAPPAPAPEPPPPARAPEADLPPATSPPPSDDSPPV